MDKNEIVGTGGSIRFSTFDESPIELLTSSTHQKFEFQNPDHIQQPLIQTIVNTLNGTDECPSTGESAARTSWVIDEILKEWRFRNNIQFE